MCERFRNGLLIGKVYQLGLSQPQKCFQELRMNTRSHLIWAKLLTDCGNELQPSIRKTREAPSSRETHAVAECGVAECGGLQAARPLSRPFVLAHASSLFQGNL